MWNPPVHRRGAADAPQRAGRGGRPARRARRAAARGRSASSSRARRSSWSAKIVADRLADEDAGARRARRALPRRLHAAAAARARGPADRAASCSRVVTTDALELGIDIGALDAAVVVTFPGTVASLRQMWGRAGRRGRGLAVYVAGEDALDQFFCRHPDEFLDRAGRGGDPRARERADPPRAPAVRRARGAARATPTRSSSGRAGGRTPRRSWPRASCVERARAVRAAPARGLPGRARVAALGLARLVRGRRRRRRASCSARSRRRARSRPSTRARSTCTWAAPTRCVELDLDARRALVEPFDGDWYTQPKKETDT